MAPYLLIFVHRVGIEHLANSSLPTPKWNCRYIESREQCRSHVLSKEILTKDESEAMLGRVNEIDGSKYCQCACEGANHPAYFTFTNVLCPLYLPDAKTCGMKRTNRRRRIARMVFESMIGEAE